MIEFLIGLIIVLLGFLGIFKWKLDKKDTELIQKTKALEKEKTQSEVYKTAVEHTQESVQEIEKVESEYKEIEEKLDEAESPEDIINIANSNVDKFNKLPND